MIGRRAKPLTQGDADGDKTSSRREPPTAEHMLDVLRGTLYASPFSVFSGVRSAVGARVTDLGIADGVVADTSHGERIVLRALEVKRSQSDLAAELADPSKALAVGRYCETFELVLPAPAKNFLGSKLQIPFGWGLIEVDGPRATRLKDPTNRRAEPAPQSFINALLRSAGAHVRPKEHAKAAAPERRIVGYVSGDVVILGPCLHYATRPRAKNASIWLPCFGCLAEEPSHSAAIAAALDDADPEALESYAVQIARLLGRRVA